MLALALSALVAAPGASRASDAVYRDALLRLDAGDSAAAHLLASTGHDKLLDKVVRWIELTRLHAPTSFAEIESFLQASPDWPGQVALRLRAEEQIVHEAGNETALAWFATHPPQSRDGKIRYGEALRAKGREAEGNSWIKRAWIEDNFSAPEEKSYLEKYRPLIDAADQVARLDKLIWRQQFDQAKRQMKHVDEGHRWVADARMKLLGSQPGFEATLRKVPASLENDPGLLYARIHWRRLKGHDRDARQLLLKVPPNVPRPDLWWREREVEIRSAIDDGAYSEAYRLARDHRVTGGAELAEAEFLAGWIALRLQHDPHVAFQHFDNLYNAVRTPVSQARGAYWAGRAEEAQRRTAQAQAWYEKAAVHTTTFYGQLAAAKLASDKPVQLPTDPVPDKSTIDSFTRREVAQIVRKLADIGAQDHVDPFVMRLADIAREPEEAALTAALARSVGRPDLGVSVARRVTRQGITLVEAGYPMLTLRSPPVTEPALTHAVIRQESAFAAQAVSRAGARGLMQLMPATAKAIAGKLNIPFSEGRLIEPTYNVELGENYLSRVVGGFDGSYVLGLAAYNAGPARVRQWLQEIGDPRGGKMDVIDWIERIPFSETRNYVERVLEGLQVYRLRLGAPPVVRTAAAVPAAASPWCLLACVKDPLPPPAPDDVTLENTPGDGGSAAENPDQ